MQENNFTSQKIIRNRSYCEHLKDQKTLECAAQITEFQSLASKICNFMTYWLFLDHFPVDNSMRVLQNCIHKFVNKSLFKTHVAKSVKEFYMAMLVFIHKYQEPPQTIISLLNITTLVATSEFKKNCNLGI